MTDFEREFPSLCFALATGVGKTRLMGAFISYLHLAHGINNFFVLAPNLTIYNKLITDFTPNTPKYVFKGIAEFATDAPAIITGDNYEATGRHAVRPVAALQGQHLQHLEDQLRSARREVAAHQAAVGIHRRELFRLSGRAATTSCCSWTSRTATARQRRRARDQRAEADPGAGTDGHAVRGDEQGRGAVQERDLRLSARQGDGGRLRQGAGRGHAQELQSGRHVAGGDRAAEAGRRRPAAREREGASWRPTPARPSNPIVKPFLLVIARDTTHAGQLLQLIQSDDFFEGRYKDKVIQVDSSKTGAEEDEMIERLLKVEHTDEPTEIVIHVNMLKEGWDVTNLYTIVPLRAANARILIEQSIGRGLRLPYGKRTGVTAVDRLNIVAHDKFQEIIDEANKPDSPIRLQTGGARSRAAGAEDGDRGVAVATCRRKLGHSARPATHEHASWPASDAAAVFHEAGRAEGRADRLRGDPQAGEPAADAAERRLPAEAGGPGRDRQGGRRAVSAGAAGAGRR